MRIARLDDYFDAWATEPARAAVDRVCAALDVRDRASFAYAEKARAAAFVITGSEAGSLHRERLQRRYDDFEPLSRDRLIAGSLIPASWYVRAQKIRRLALEEMLALFDRYDLLIAAATPLCAPSIGSEWIEINGHQVPTRPSIGLLSQPISAIGLPVCTVPVWPASAPDPHLPIGVQLIAAPWREDLCLSAAARLEAMGIATATNPTPSGL